MEICALTIFIIKLNMEADGDDDDDGGGDDEEGGDDEDDDKAEKLGDLIKPTRRSS